MTSKITVKRTWTKFALMTGKELKQKAESSTTLKSLVLGGNKTNGGKQRILLWPRLSKMVILSVNLAKLAAIQNQSATMTTTTSRWM